MITLYLPGRSWAHRTPARVKLLTLALCGALLLPVDNLALLAAASLAALALFAALGPRGLRQLRPLFSFAIVLLVLFVIHAAIGSAHEGGVVVLRIVVLMLLAHFVTLTTRMDDMLEAISPIFAPLRLVGIAPRRPALALTLVLRFAPVLLAVYGMLQDAHQARTGKRTHWRLLAPFALQALRMSENVAEALSARGGADGIARRRPDNTINN